MDVHDPLIDLNERVESWKTLDFVQCLVTHPTAKHYLLKTVESGIRVRLQHIATHHTSLSFSSISSEHFFSNLYSQEIFDRLFAIDTMAVDAQLLSVLQNRWDYQRVVIQRGKEAQYLLNILQTVRPYAVAFPFLCELAQNSVWNCHWIRLLNGLLWARL